MKRNEAAPNGDFPTKSPVESPARCSALVPALTAISHHDDHAAMLKDPPRKGNNFDLLPPERASTKNMIEAILDARDPQPWSGPPARRDRPPLARLATRIRERAKAGKEVRLTPATALNVANALYHVADGPVSLWEVDRAYAMRVVTYGADDVGEVVAYCRNLEIAIGAYNGAVKSMPGARLAVRHFGFSPRKNFSDR